MKKTTILIVDDHAVVRMGLSAIINLERDLVVCGEAESGESAVLLAEEDRRLRLGDADEGGLAKIFVTVLRVDQRDALRHGGGGDFLASAEILQEFDWVVKQSGTLGQGGQRLENRGLGLALQRGRHGLQTTVVRQT